MPTAVAIDREGGQAIVHADGKWLRIGAYLGWKPIQLRDAADAARCLVNGIYERASSTMGMDEVPGIIRSMCEDVYLTSDDIVFAAIMDQCPMDLRLRYGLVQVDEARGAVGRAAATAPPPVERISYATLRDELLSSIRSLSNTPYVTDLLALIWFGHLASSRAPGRELGSGPTLESLAARLAGMSPTYPLAEVISQIEGIDAAAVVHQVASQARKLRGFEAAVFYGHFLGRESFAAHVADTDQIWGKAHAKVLLYLSRIMR